MVHQLRSMSEQVDELSRLLAADRAQPLGPAGSSPHLLPIHFQLQHLETFRNATLHQARRTAHDAQGRADLETLARWFEPLDAVAKDFEGWLFEVGGSILEAVREGNGGAVVRLLKVVEVEGRADQKAVALRLVRKMAGGVGGATGGNGAADATVRVIKNYRHKLLDAIQTSVQRSFSDALDRADGDHLAFLDALGWIYQDLLRIEDAVVPLFPADYDIHGVFVRAYHTRLDAALQSIVALAPEAGVLLRMHAWVKEYRASMKDLGVPAAWLQPPLLGGKAQDLIEDYVRLIVTKLDEWSANLIKTETRDFAARDTPPEQEADGMYGMQGAVILFQMVNQQVDLAADSGQGAVLARVVAEAARVMQTTQAQWTRVLDAEYRRQTERPDEVPPGLVEYVVALANDQLRCADYAEALSTRLEPLVSDKYKTVIAEQLNAAIDGYLDVAKKCTQVLIDLVFNDLKTVQKGLFQLAWYTDGLVEQIVETMRDYMSDYQGHLNASIFDLLVEDLIVNFLTIYLNALRRVPAKGLRIPAAINRIKEDVRLAFTFFSSYKASVDLEQDFEILDMVLAMLSASSQMMFMDFWQFAKKHGPNMAFVEALVKGRDDLDKPTMNDVIETLRRRVRDEGLGDPPEPTIMVSSCLTDRLITAR